MWGCERGKLLAWGLREGARAAGCNGMGGGRVVHLRGQRGPRALQAKDRALVGRALEAKGEGASPLCAIGARPMAWGEGAGRSRTGPWATRMLHAGKIRAALCKGGAHVRRAAGATD